MKESKIGIKVKRLKVFDEGEEGRLFETLRGDDELFDGVFGQNLMSFVKPGIIKGLHYHDVQTEYTTCVKGRILYVAIKEVEGGEPVIEKYEMGDDNMIMLKNPPGVWHGYINLGDEEAVILYTSDKAYDPDNVDQKDKDVNAFGDVWKL